MSVSVLAVRTCAVCDRVMPGARLFGQRVESELLVCGSLPCTQIVSRRTSMGAAAFQQYLKTQKTLLQQTRLLNLQRTHQARIEAAENHWATLRLRARVELDALQERRSPVIPNDNQITTEIGLPTGPLVTVAADPDRCNVFRDHLRNVVGEAFAVVTSQPGAEPAIDASDDGASSAQHPVQEPAQDEGQPYGPFSGQLCGVCAGGCCPVGANHAFVTADTIKRVQSQGVPKSAQDLEALYMTYLPDESQEGGCIYQQAQGCALPRELRGDTCNTYVCDSFRVVQEAEQASALGAQLPLQAVIVVQRRQNQWLRDKPALDNGVTGLAVIKADSKVLRFGLDDLTNVEMGGGVKNHRPHAD